MRIASSTLSSLYPHRAGSAPRIIRALPLPEDVTTLYSDGVSVDPGGRAARTLRRYEQPQFYSPILGSAKNPRSSWCRDWAEHEMRVSQTLALIDALEPYADLDPLAAEEISHLSKACVMSGGVPGWSMIGKKSRINKRDTDLNYDVLDELFTSDDFLAALKESQEEDQYPYPSNTNTGWPSYSPGSDALKAQWIAAVYITQHGSGFDAVKDIGREIGPDLDAVAEPSPILFTRAGPNKKVDSVMEVRGLKVLRSAEVQGVCARRRIVLGVPGMVNMTLLPLLIAVKTLSKRQYYTYHGRTLRTTLLQRTVMKRRWATGTYSDDCTNFDWSVSRGDQLGLAAHLEKKWPQLKELLAFWLDSEKMPILANGPGVTGFTLWPKIGCTTTGIAMTSAANTIINLVRVVCAMARSLGLTERDFARKVFNREAGVFVQGDDSLIVSKEVDQDRYIQTNKEMGYTAKMTNHPVFLMRWHDARRAYWHPIASRVWLNTVWPEHARASEAVEILGLWSRTINILLNPYWPFYEKVIFSSELAIRHGLRNIQDLATLAERYAASEEITKATLSPLILRDLAVKAEEGDHAAIRLLAAFGLSPEDAMEGITERLPIPCRAANRVSMTDVREAFGLTGTESLYEDVEPVIDDNPQDKGV